MAFHVIDPEEGFSGSRGESFGVCEADEEGGGEAGTAGSGECGDVIESNSGVLECLLHEGANPLGVIATGDLGDDAAVFAMDLDLRRDERGQEYRRVALAPDDGDRRFVAGGFDGEDHYFFYVAGAIF